MLFMMALSVSSHFSCFWRGWILFLSDERSGAWEEVKQLPLPLPSAWIGMRQHFSIPKLFSRVTRHLTCLAFWKLQVGIFQKSVLFID